MEQLARRSIPLGRGLGRRLLPSSRLLAPLSLALIVMICCHPRSPCMYTDMQPSSHFPEYQIEVDSEVAGRTVELTGACLHRIYS